MLFNTTETREYTREDEMTDLAKMRADRIIVKETPSIHHCRKIKFLDYTFIHITRYIGEFQWNGEWLVKADAEVDNAWHSVMVDKPTSKGVTNCTCTFGDHCPHMTALKFLFDVLDRNV